MTLKEFNNLPEHVRDSVFCLWAQEEFQTTQEANEFLRHLREDDCEICFNEMTRRLAIFIDKNCTLEMLQEQNNKWIPIRDRNLMN